MFLQIYEDYWTIKSGKTVELYKIIKIKDWFVIKTN